MNLPVIKSAMTRWNSTDFIMKSHTINCNKSNYADALVPIARDEKKVIVDVLALLETFDDLRKIAFSVKNVNVNKILSLINFQILKL